MKKVILCICALAYLSGIITIAFGHFVQPAQRPPPPPSELETTERFIARLDNYPWVNHAHRFQDEKELLYYGQITYLYKVDSRIGINLLGSDFLQDSVTEEEGRALQSLVALSERDPEMAVSISQSAWFQKGISSEELALLEKILTLAHENAYVAQNVTSSDWFFFAGTQEVDRAVSTMADMPSDLAIAVSFAPWFKSDFLSEFRAIDELMILYQEDKSQAINLSFVYTSGDFEPLQRVNALYAADRGLADAFFQYNTFSRENFLVLSDLSLIAAVNKELAHSLVGTVTKDRAEIIFSLAGIYALDPQIGEVASQEFLNNRNALRYLRKAVEMGVTDPESLRRGAAFVSDNPEFIYEDRVEPYRYHLMTEILSRLPAEKAREYKDLIFATCAVYGNRFYLWQNAEYNTLHGLSYDRTLTEEEKEAVLAMLTFFITKNDEGLLAVDLRKEESEYLYGVVDIPFTHTVDCDGRVSEAVHADQGTGFVLAIIHNVETLEERFERVQVNLRQQNGVEYSYTNPLVELIGEEGGNQDRFFVYFCAKNWELGACLEHALNTRMDSIVMGISTTAMYWSGSGSAHMYPAYIPSHAIAETIRVHPDAYGDPLVYRQFVAPYDRAGFKEYLDRDIKIVEIYDLHEEKKVCLLDRTEERRYDEMLIVVVVGVVVILGGVKAVRRSRALSARKREIEHYTSREM